MRVPSSSESSRHTLRPTRQPSRLGLSVVMPGKNQDHNRLAALVFRRVVASARDAMDHQIVDLSALGVHQNRVAMAASVINRVRTSDQSGRRADDRANSWGGNDLQAYFWVRCLLRCAHGVAP